jgi:hypothetical protein
VIERLGADVGRELKRFGPQGGMGALVAAWPGAVGESIASNAWPARFGTDGTLFVATRDAVWAFELGQRADEILGRLGPLAPRSIRFATGRVPDPVPSGATKAPSPAPPQPGPEELRRAAELAATIDDEELRELVARAAAASLARPPADR